MMIAVRFLSASALVALSWAKPGQGSPFRPMKVENRISSPLAKVNSGLGISGEGFLNVCRAERLDPSFSLLLQLELLTYYIDMHGINTERVFLGLSRYAS